MKYILYISIILLAGCSIEQPSNGIATETYYDGNSLIKTEYCLLDIMNGDPTSGGCWTLISVPPGSTITQNDLTGDNPCIEFGGQPCPNDYVFEYQALCGGCEDCIEPATLTICLTCDPPVCNVIITATCN